MSFCCTIDQKRDKEVSHAVVVTIVSPPSCPEKAHLSFSLPPVLESLQVPTRFQSVEQYCEIFRGLLLEEIFGNLVSKLSEGSRGGGRGRGGDNGVVEPNSHGSGSAPLPPMVSMVVTTFVEAGEGGFSYVTLASEGSGGKNDYRGGHGGGGRQNYGTGRSAGGPAASHG